MDPNKLTQKSQEALQAAQALAIEMSHQEVDVEHLLLSLLQQDQGLVPRLLRRPRNLVLRNMRPQPLRPQRLPPPTVATHGRS